MNTKSDLRVSARQLRDAVHADFPNAGQVLADKFPLSLLKRFGPVIAGYKAIGSEIDPAPLLLRLKSLGAQIVYPRVDAEYDMSFRQVDSASDFEAGAYGISEPKSETDIAHPTLVLVPLLAFDAAGNRLGYGKGYYDRALSRLRQNGRVFVCGLSFAEQEVVTIPADPNDVPLDWIVTPNGSIPLFFARVAGSSNDAKR